MPEKNKPNTEKKPGVFSLLKPYTGLLSLLILFALFSNSITLWMPKIIGHGIDDYGRSVSTHTPFDLNPTLIKFSAAIFFVFIFSYLQSIIQTYASEKVARDMRTRLSLKLSEQSSTTIDSLNPSKLLTNLTADVDSIKTFVSQALVSIVSSVFIIIGASIMLLTINWKLALCVIAFIPIIGITFAVVLKKVRVLFKERFGVYDWLNKVISESILGSALIRVINSQSLELEKFLKANTKARDLGLKIIRLFSGLIPVITFTANVATLTILALGGHFVIMNTLTLGDFAAFNNYLMQLIFPILVIGFMSGIIAQATASYGCITSVLEAPDPAETGTNANALRGDVELKDVNLLYGQKPALKDISLSIKAGSKIAIIGPTAAGKTQLLYLMTNLIKPNSGEVLFDGRKIDEYNSEAFHSQVGFVFQDSIIFNMSIRENIAFSDTVTDESLQKAIDTAELHEFVDSLPERISTVVSERGSSL